MDRLSIYEYHKPTKQIKRIFYTKEESIQTKNPNYTYTVVCPSEYRNIVCEELGLNDILDSYKKVESFYINRPRFDRKDTSFVRELSSSTPESRESWSVGYHIDLVTDTFHSDPSSLAKQVARVDDSTLVMYHQSIQDTPFSFKNVVIREIVTFQRGNMTLILCPTNEIKTSIEESLSPNVLSCPDEVYYTITKDLMYSSIQRLVSYARKRVKDLVRITDSLTPDNISTSSKIVSRYYKIQHEVENITRGVHHYIRLIPYCDVDQKNELLSLINKQLEVTNELSSVLDTIYNRINNFLSVDTAKSTRLFSVIALIFMPITFLVAIFSMGFPFAEFGNRNNIFVYLFALVLICMSFLLLFTQELFPAFGSLF